MFVLKRDGRKEEVQFDKVLSRIQKLCSGLDLNYVNPAKLAQKVIEGIYEGVSTAELDTLAAELAATMTTQHPDYAILASRIAVSNLHKNTSSSFFETMHKLFHFYDEKSKRNAPLVSEDVYLIVKENRELLDSSLKYERDFCYEYFGYKTLERSYLLKIDGKVIERPQHMLMRVSLGIHKNDLSAAIETYNLMSEKWFTHATPTLFNSGTPNPQMSSCFLLQTKDDSIDGIFDTIKDCAKISQAAGGIGVSIQNVRATGSYIRGTGGSSNGIIPMLRVYNDTARYIDQGGGKRKGSFAVYLEPWHADIFSFLDLRKNTGKEEIRTRDLFTALWIPDLFMKRVEENSTWSLFCPNEAPGLDETWGEHFDDLYLKYEREGKARKVIKAQDLWLKIIESQIETGTPYILFKDSCNRKSNQQNLGALKCSNLCAEILEYVSKDEIAVCNLASIALPKFVENEKFNFQKLIEVTKTITKNLNKIIDVNYYPVKEAKVSNLRHRPLGIGVQGLADALCLMRYSYDSEEGRKLNLEIFETIYFAALSASCELAKEHGPYESYSGSPLSKGLFQYDMWGVEPTTKWDWSGLKKNVLKYGARNSLLVALMPTASTSQILGNNECFEPFTQNMYTRRVLSGEYVVVNKYLLKDLIKLGLWTDQMRKKLFLTNGSIQNINEIPDEIKALYKTVWEIKQKTLIDMAIDRGPYICQTQSLNLFVESPNIAKLTSMLFYAWKGGLKTGMYYLRSKGAVDAIKFTANLDVQACPVDCLSCSG